MFLTSIFKSSDTVIGRHVFRYRNIYMNQYITLIANQQIGCLYSSHIVVCVYATDMLSFPFNCDDWNVIGSKLLGRKSMAQYNQTFNFISHQFIQVLLFQVLFVTAYEYKEFVVVVTVAGQKLIQHLRIVVQI